MVELTEIDIVMDALCNASASGMTLTDCIRLLEDSGSLLAWNEAVNIFGVEGIESDDYKFAVIAGNLTIKRK